MPINSVTVLEEKNGFFPANSQLPSFGAISEILMEILPAEKEISVKKSLKICCENFYSLPHTLHNLGRENYETNTCVNLARKA